ncbi:hypothetical protein F4780DRAFT_80280 [Xylariomycetidae sp. FL0641]|nr:hypothetical protein F4780DRAFT_80280 [Xylariomycetidae sp. FL0641]
MYRENAKPVIALDDTDEGSTPESPCDEKSRRRVQPTWARASLSLPWNDFQRFYQAFDWGNTDLGPRATWPPELRHAVRFLMADPSPGIIYWGENHTVIYNEAHVPLVGDKHPAMMGQAARDVFPDFWDDFAEIIAEQRCSGRAASGEASLLLMERRGFLEETYFDWKLVPIFDDNGEVKGSYSMPSDLTWEVISVRQHNCIQELTRRTAEVNTINDLWKSALSGLESNEIDIPFALLYTVDQRRPSSAYLETNVSAICRLEGSIGLDTGHQAARDSINSRNDADGFAPSLLEVLRSNATVVLDAHDQNIKELLSGISWKGHKLPSEQVAVVPILSDSTTSAFLIAGLNPYRRYHTQLFRRFFQTMGEVLGGQVSRVRLAQEVQHHDRLARRATQDLERSETRFSRFADRSIAGLSMMGLDGKILYGNESWYKFFGIDPSKGNDVDWLDTIMPDDIEIIHKCRAEVLRTKQGVTFQVRTKLSFRQGGMFSAHKTAICACYADTSETGDVETIMLLMVDISELKYVEQQLLNRTKELEESESKYRNYAEHCPLGICRTDPEGYVLYGNDAWHSYYNFTRGQVYDPQPWLPFVHEDDIPACKNFFDRVQTCKAPTVVEFKMRDRMYTFSEGGRTFVNHTYVLATGFSAFKDDGSVDYIDFWVTNISAQKMAERILAEKMEEAIRLRDQQERFIDMISHEIRNPLSAVLHCGEEVIYAMRNGCMALDTLTAGPGSHSTSTSHQYLRSQLSSAKEAAHTILYCVQHQKQIVDDVLTLSKLDTDLLVVSPVPIQLVPLLRSSLKIFEYELRMTGITLSIVEDESISSLGIDWVLLDPNRFIQIIINLVTNAIKFTKASQHRQITVTAAALVHRPPESLHNVDFVPQRYRPSTPVSATGTYGDRCIPHQAPSDIYLSFAVKDTGHGLTPDEKALLFQRFAQASPKTHIEYGGSGLGLFISRQITEMLGGEIGVASTPGSGSTFAFYVKSQKTDAPPASPASPEPLVRVGRSLSLTADGIPVEPVKPLKEMSLETKEIVAETVERQQEVLVVEDNLINQKVLCKQLRQRDFGVHATNHGKEALDAVMERRSAGGHDQALYFDVVLCDIEMPVMNGIEFTREVRRLEAEGILHGHVPILGVTANVRSTQVTDAIKAGMDGVTTKPYRINELIEHMHRVCQTE